ncbi:hypothetical protein LTR62_008207 [Meristemomyces frigidus]|uniref:Uncharacterized protein n=1 Tax=Meristemomyces frigidus TaxID=1508187 RepID=A0AAN7TAZ3_9PEZI|nr:hypothetical protein LTR62_008207 [Meristemomyces frigidus]
MQAPQDTPFDCNALLEADEGSSAFPTSSYDFSSTLTLDPVIPVGNCPSHPGDSCLCHGLLGDWDLAIPVSTAIEDILPSARDEPDYSKFEDFIPRFVRPEKPCDYCKSKRLNCYLQRGEATCTPCKSLFRCCSLENSNTLESINYFDKDRGTFLDTLHAVDEDQCCNGGITGVKTLLSRGRTGMTTPPVNEDDAPGSSKRNGIRFPRHAVKVLRDWLDIHADHPYPSEAEKSELERRTDLKSSQIANWLANARRRRKATDRNRPRVCASPSLRPSTPALMIPGAEEKPWEELNPLQRWQNSPPEHEPAAFENIAKAVASSDLPDDSASTSPSSAGRHKKSSNGSGFSNFRAPSTTSLDTSGAQSSSLSQSSAAFSQGSSQSLGSFGSFNSSLAGKRDRRRRRRPTILASQRYSDDKKRMFQCTFCTDTFKSKYDWTRHEKSLHLSLEKWICHPVGPVRLDPATGEKKCVYCEAQNPSDDHLEEHNHRQCEDKGLDARTFYRKDHLRQHLRLMHGCSMIASIETWQATIVNINSRCGFCGQRFTVWQERVDHLTAHFKAGVRMREWKGCRGLDPAVAAQVTNAMPPYLIGMESVSPLPFSATNRTSWHLRQPCEGGQEVSEFYASDPVTRAAGTGLGSDYWTKATCWEILTVRLGKYANEMAKEGVVLTDEMLQRKARTIMYGSDDAWNQTAADNPEWLDLFKKAHGLDYIPDAVGGQGLFVPEDLETYGDLGLRIPFAVQLAAYNSKQIDDQGIPGQPQVPEAYHEALANRRAHFRDLYARLYEAGKLHDEDFRCGHHDCKDNVADISWLETNDITGSRYKRWCSKAVPSELVKPFAVYWDQALKRDQQAASEEALGNGGANAPAPIMSGSVRGLEALARMEAPMVDGIFTFPTKATRSHQSRHKMALPPDRARRFATVTGPWVDSGIMPDPFPGTLPIDNSRSLPTLEQTSHVSTGAMMEFLGGEIGAHLPFSNDADTSTIPFASLPQEYQFDDWTHTAARGGEGEAQPLDDLPLTIQDLDDLIAATTSAPHPQSYTTNLQLPATSSWQARDNPLSFPSPDANHDAHNLDADTMMQDLDFDDMIFDHSMEFDMPLDEAFFPSVHEQV